MILHPDGRAEGTPEELFRYQELKAGQYETNRVVIVPVQPVPYQHPWWQKPLEITCGGTTWQGPVPQMWNVDAAAARFPI